jgi:photosystem II stability/assembly factor-like uncharacterized protein
MQSKLTNFIRPKCIIWLCALAGILLSISAWSDSPMDIPPNWQRIGPYGSTVVDIEIAESNPQIAFCLLANKNHPIYRTEDGGQTWSPTSFHYPEKIGTLVDLAVCPQDPDFVVFINFQSEFFRSFDGGKTWTIYPNLGASAITFDPCDRNTLYGLYEETIFKTTDAGDSWQTIFSGNYYFYIYRLHIDPFNPNRIITSSRMNNVGLFLSEDGGESWRLFGFEDILIDAVEFGSQEGEIYIAADDENGDQFWRSTDSGGTWEMVYVFKDSCEEIEVSATDPETLLIISGYSSDKPSDYTKIGIFRSTNQGEDWIKIPQQEGLVFYDILTIDKINPMHLIVSDGSGFRYTLDGGVNWFMPGSEFPGSWIESVAASPFRPGYLLAHVKWNNQILLTDDNGETWKYTNFVQSMWTDTSLEFEFSHFDHETVYASTASFQSGKEIFRSKNGGMDWAAIGTMDFRATSCITESPRDEGNLIVGGREDQILRSTDGGDSWSLVYDGGNTSYTFKDIEFAPLKANNVYALKENYFASTIELLKGSNSGATWQEVSTLSNEMATDLAVSYSDPEILYFCDSLHIYRSRDQGLTWERIDSGYAYDADFCLATQKHPNWVWMLEEFDFLRSTNQGDSWKRIETPDLYGGNFGEGASFHYSGNANPFIFIGTQNDGIWVYPDSIEPQIMLAGAGALVQRDSKSLTFRAYVPVTESPSDVESVDILYDGLETGLSLFDDGTNGDTTPNDGLYTLELPWTSDGTIANLHYSIIARNKFGMISPLWPYLITK